MTLFFCRSFGILALLASFFAAFACRGPWLQTLPSWVVIIPLGLAILLGCFGTLLLLMPISRKGPPNHGARFLLKMIIGLAALGGIVLTSFYHGDTATDQMGIQRLREIAEDCLIIAPIVTLLSFLYIWLRKRGTSPVVNGHKLPVKKF